MDERDVWGPLRSSAAFLIGDLDRALDIAVAAWLAENRISRPALWPVELVNVSDEFLHECFDGIILPRLDQDPLVMSDALLLAKELLVEGASPEETLRNVRAYAADPPPDTAEDDAELIARVQQARVEGDYQPLSAIR